MEMEIFTNVTGIFIRKREQQDKLAIWFVHGFGESGFCFKEAFDAPELKQYSLHVPDFPGFGVSPLFSESHTINQSASLLTDLIKDSHNPVVLVAHSLGGLIATQAATALPEKVKGLVNVEGNLTKADCFYSGKAAEATNAAQFKADFTEEIYKMGLKDEAIRRYFVSLKMANPESLKTWGRTGVEATGEEKGGNDFLQVPCPKLYIYGKKSIPERSRKFLEKNDVEAVEFENSGHWPMLDETEKFYRVVGEFVSNLIERKTEL
ncbi:MAG: alpha/beta hydrolase [Deltaproteobacteria bacterium]|nr:alpha/beta hydrolase [Deltaproteobacteria bacterium]